MRFASLCLLLAASSQVACTDLLCEEGPPAFQLDLSLAEGVARSKVTRLRITVQAGAYVRDKTFSVGKQLVDGSTSVVVHLDDKVEGAFTAKVMALALGKADGAVHAWGQGTFSGTGDSCNFFSLKLAEGAPKDLDGDGVTAPLDCDDMNPCRSPMLGERKNLCQGTVPPLTEACKSWLAKQGKTTKAPYCGDGLDQDCNGQDVPCAPDEDCDNYSPPGDCNDKDAKINPGALETCDGKDNNCNKVVDEGCTPCDVDGDGFAAVASTAAGCKLPKTDPDDYDSGVFPGAAKAWGGAEGGSVQAALRGWCSYSPSKNSTNDKRIAHRDVDHDGDGKPGTSDGCPSTGCDKDGDGFKNSSCKPAPGMVDCNDKDPHTFPGAPDFCGDGKAQDCKADVPCSKITDNDDDHYSATDDCNDNDKFIHPWAKEVCDRRDNDCDGLIDEGNPDAKGLLMRTNAKLCNDNNVGRCAPPCKPGSSNCSSKGRTLSGVCACSALIPSTVRGTSRAACGGEDLKAPASPRCFTATQPSAERCDTDDWDCNGVPDDPTGANFADKGLTCGVNTGGCKAGAVVGCDLKTTTPNASLVLSVLKKKGVNHNTHWLCSKETALPIPEACNGKDDDCDGALPDSEKDQDKDKYLACTTCSKGSKREDLATALKGCGDCSDKDQNVYPSAPELCNGKDDNCKNGASDDGINQCPPKGMVCCAGQKACLDIKTNVDNCGNCGQLCNKKVADKCKNKKCVCGNKNSSCSDGLNCVSGQCTCVSGSSTMCDGCCQGGKCVKLSSQSAAKCGKVGNACNTCGDNNDCTNDTCASGVCKISQVTNLTTCKLKGISGKCLYGACCTGCFSAGKCNSGKVVNFCGVGGVQCQNCDTGNQCVYNNCTAGGSCQYSNKPNNTSCSDGKCYNGACCKGCIDYTAGTCVGTSSVSACGVKGANCQKCVTGVKCKVPACLLGTCSTVNQINGSPCGTNRFCQNGVCVVADSGPPQLPPDAGP